MKSVDKLLNKCIKCYTLFFYKRKMAKKLECIACRKNIWFRESYYINTDTNLTFCEKCMAWEQISDPLSWDIAITDGFTDEEIRAFEAFREDAWYWEQIELELDEELLKM